MTERERWAVYPLLFLTLGIALKDKIFRVVNVDNVQCKSLLCNAVLVTNQKGRQQVIVSSDKEGGFVRTYGNENRLQVVLGHTPRLGGLLFVDSQGRIQVNPGSIYALPAETLNESGDAPKDAHPRDPPTAPMPPDSAP